MSDTKSYQKKPSGQPVYEIAIPSKFQSKDPNEQLRWHEEDGSYRQPQLFYIYYMAVEGASSNVKNTDITKLVIRHHVTRNHAKEMIVILQGYWNEYEKPDLETCFERNFFVDTNYKGWQEQKLQEYKQALISYLYEYFHNDSTGKYIMELVRRKNRLVQEKLERQGAPHYDKIVRESCERLKARYHIVTIWETGQMYYYKDGKYVFGAERIIEEECQTIWNYDARSYMIEEIKKAIKRQTYHDLSEFDADLNIVNVKNGLYHIKEKVLTEPTPDYLSLDQKPITYDPEAKCPTFEEKFLSECLYPSQIKTVKQCMAYTFYRANPYEHYVIHVGYGWNGKSKLNNTMVKLHGENNVSYVPFNDIGKDQYALAGLERKSLNIDNEPSGGVIKNTAILKKISGSESVRVQEKYVKAHNAKLYAKLWFSTNDIPNIQDDSIGRFRREIVIMWPFTFKPNPNPNNPMEKQDDPDIEEKITTDAELSGIFKMLMDELHDILYKQKKRIHVDMSDIEHRRKHRELLKNPIQYFVENVIDLESSTFEDSIRKDELYKIYEKFCQLNKVLSEDKENFGKKLKRIIGKDRLIDNLKESTKDPATGKRMTLYKGIKVKPEWLDESDRDKQTSLITRDEDEEEGEEEQSSDITQDNNSGEKKATQMSGMSGQNQENESYNKENDAQISLASRSEITSDTPKIPVQDVSKHENAMTSMTSRSPKDHIESSDIEIHKIIEKAMIGLDGKSQGYFTLNDWKTTLMFLPVQHPLFSTEEEAELMLHQLLQEGRIVSLGTDKYQTTTTNTANTTIHELSKREDS